MQFPKPKLIISDFDGTISHGHRLTKEFPAILETCAAHNIPFIVHTGRSISWAHFLVTHYDEIPFAMAEGGGVYVSRGERGLLEEKYLVNKEERERLAGIAQEVQQQFKINLSVDSLGRVTDRAIELRDLDEAENPKLKQEIKSYFDAHGVNYSQSNVHVNFWVGDVDKYQGLLFFLGNEFPQVSLDDIWFFGDSMNDAPMFEKLPYTVGVSNIKNILGQLDKKPTVVMEGTENEGPFGVLNFLQQHLS